MSFGGSTIEDRIARRLGLAAAAATQARAIRERLEDVDPSMFGILCDLELVEEEALVRVISEATGVPQWDGRHLDADLAFNVHVPGALALYRDRATVYYATHAPWDEDMRAAVRLTAGATLAEPLVASQSTIAEAASHARLLSRIPALQLDLDTFRRGHAAAPPAAPKSAAESALREAWDEGLTDNPVVRLANQLLLEAALAPGRSIRVEAFDVPAVRVGSCGHFDAALDVLGGAWMRPLHEQIVWRWSHMGELDAAMESARGWVRMLAGRPLSFELFVERTERGLSAVVCRETPPLGGGVPERPEFEALKACMTRLHSGDSEPGFEAERTLLQNALRAAEQLGPDAAMERVYLMQALGNAHLEAGHESEAALHLDRAFGQWRAHGFSGRSVEAELLYDRGYAEILDLAQRGELFLRAQRLLDAPGPGRRPAHKIILARMVTDHCAGELERALETAAQVREHVVAWFGAPTRTVCEAQLVAARCHAGLGRGEMALESAEEAVSLGRRLGRAEDWEEALSQGEACGAASRHDEAVLHLRRALGHEAPIEERPFQRDFASAALARELEALGRFDEARALANDALSHESHALCIGARRELEAVRQRGGPYR